jgi:ubiquitin-protein ligase
MFCRVEKGRVDLMKIMIMGASGTPYAHGAFVYDLFFPDTYPNNAPKCLLVTTGGGQVRFNPNLYNQGKVCLSLLGTWGGSNTETWDPKLSTILQLVMSIQAIIMSNEVYFNEPGYEHEMSTPAGEKKNTGYSNIVKYCNVKFAIIEAIKSPPKGFEKVIRRNFFLKKQMILDEVKEWCIQAKDEANAVYSGLVSSHNSTWATKL